MAHELIAVLTQSVVAGQRDRGAVDRVTAGTRDRGSRFRKCRVNTITSETKIILGSTIGTTLTTAIAVLITALFMNLGSGIDSRRGNIREDPAARASPEDPDLPVDDARGGPPVRGWPHLSGHC